jgi:hypothetical protein
MVKSQIGNLIPDDAAPKLLARLKDEFQIENIGKVRSSGHAPWLSTLKGVEGRAGASGWD